MKSYKTKGIERSVRENFLLYYANAGNFEGTPLYERCLKVIGNAADLREIVSENDKGIPPVQTLLALFEKHGFPVEEIADYDSQCIGKLMAYVFERVFLYKNRKGGCPITDNFGIKTAALYSEHELFEITE